MNLPSMSDYAMAKKEQDVFEILKQLEATPGTNDKLAILKENKDNSLLRQFFYMTLNPHLLFGIKQIPEYHNDAHVTGLFDAMTELKKLSTRELTGNDAIRHLQYVLGRLTEENQEVIKRLIKKDPECKVGYKLVNKVWKKLIPVTPYMRCSSANEKNYARVNYPAAVEKKANGLFLNIICFNGEVIVQSRNGNILDLHGCLDHDVLALLQDRNFVLHGEGLVLGDEGNFLDRKTGNGIINKAIQGTISYEEASRVVVECWDVVKYEHWVDGKSDVTFDKRSTMLRSMLNPARPELIGKLIAIEQRIVHNFDEAYAYFKELLARGEEGAVIKNMTGIWKNHTSPNQVKMKVKDPADLICVGTTEHTKQPGWIGALVLESSDGIIKVKTGSGLTEDDRQLPPEHYIGKIIEIEYNEITEDKKTKQKSLFLPIFVEVRHDKDEADSYEMILERSSNG